MRRLSTRGAAGRALAFAVAVAVMTCLPAQAGVSVSGPFVDDTTGGDWRGTYGECFFLIPDTNDPGEEIPTGPDFFGDNHEQYRYLSCYGGPFFDNDPAESEVDWRIFINDPSTPGDDPARAFVFDEIFPPRPGSEQWNPCLQDFHGATWDNLDHVNDPITIEVELEADGEIELAYYFVDADNVCRDAAFELFVNGSPVADGQIENFASGKYVWFVISGLTGTNTFRLDVVDAPGTPTCVPPLEWEGVNSHVSGVFIGGPACEGGVEPFCGDGEVQDGEECDDGNDEDGDGCDSDCQVEPPVGGEGCTPGFWKNHLNHWTNYAPNASFNSTFGVTASFGNLTLQQAVNLNGGGERALARHAVAALLNASSPDVDADYTTAGVIAIVQSAYATGNFEGAKNQLEGANEQDCPLGGDNTTSRFSNTEVQRTAQPRSTGSTSTSMSLR